VLTQDSAAHDERDEEATCAGVGLDGLAGKIVTPF
jgi:hypothetical protein